MHFVSVFSMVVVFFFKQKTAYEMRISDWSSDVCSSDLWIGWIDLHNRDEAVAGAITLKLRRVSWWKRPWVYLHHPDPAVRLSGWLGWLSVILGASSLVLTIKWSCLGE